MALVVGRVLQAVCLVQLTESDHDLFHRRAGGQVHNQRPDLGAQEVVWAGGAQGCECGELLSRAEVQHHLGVGVVPHLRVVGGGQAADDRRQRRSAAPAFGRGQRLEPGDDCPERLGLAAVCQEGLRRGDDLQ